MSATSMERTDPPQSNVIVIVTGGARGLGRAMTLALLRGGKRVVVADLPESAAEVDRSRARKQCRSRNARHW
jgi:3-oxoacyl-[acyl-carrier protein] reductase